MWKKIQSLFALKAKKKIKERIAALESLKLDEEKVNFVNGLLQNLAQAYVNKKKILRYALNERTKYYVIKKSTGNSLERIIQTQLGYLGNLREKMVNFAFLLRKEGKHTKHADIVVYLEKIEACNGKISEYKDQLDRQLEEVGRMAKLAEIRQNPELFEEKEKIQFLRNACRDLYKLGGSIERQVELLKKFIDDYGLFEKKFREGLEWIGNAFESQVIKAVSVNGKPNEDKKKFFEGARNYCRFDENWYYHYRGEYKRWVEYTEKRLEECRILYTNLINTDTYYPELIAYYFKDDVQKYLDTYYGYRDRVEVYRRYLGVYW